MRCFYLVPCTHNGKVSGHIGSVHSFSTTSRKEGCQRDVIAVTSKIFAQTQTSRGMVGQYVRVISIPGRTRNVIAARYHKDHRILAPFNHTESNLASTDADQLLTTKVTSEPDADKNCPQCAIVFIPVCFFCGALTSGRADIRAPLR